MSTQFSVLTKLLGADNACKLFVDLVRRAMANCTIPITIWLNKIQQCSLGVRTLSGNKLRVCINTYVVRRMLMQTCHQVTYKRRENSPANTKANLRRAML